MKSGEKTTKQEGARSHTCSPVGYHGRGFRSHSLAGKPTTRKPMRLLSRKTTARLLPVLLTMGSAVHLSACKCGATTSTPRRASCTPTQDWASKAQCAEVTIASDIQWFEGYTLEAGVPRHTFCRSFLDSSGKAKNKSCGGTSSYQRVPCTDFGIRGDVSCFACSQRSEDEQHQHLRAFAPDCSLGLTVDTINTAIGPSACDATLSALCAKN